MQTKAHIHAPVVRQTLWAVRNEIPWHLPGLLAHRRKLSTTWDAFHHIRSCAVVRSLLERDRATGVEDKYNESVQTYDASDKIDFPALLLKI